MIRVILSAAISLDGYLDDTMPDRLVLSGEEDWREVRSMRAECDAILVGAETLRKDDPALITKDGALVACRRKKGVPDDPIKVVVSSKGDLDPSLRFFTTGSGEKIIVVPLSASAGLEERFAGIATVLRASSGILTARNIVSLLEARGVRSLMVEGGSRILTMFLAEGVFDEFRLAVAPFFVGDANAPRLTGVAEYINNKDNRMILHTARRVGDMAVMTYSSRAINDMDLEMIRKTVELSRFSPKSDTAYSVGAVIVTTDGEVFTGYSRETASSNHAEEEAIIKAEAARAQLAGATIYSSMEPCSTRKSKPLSCSELIIAHGFARVVFAAYEPDDFVHCEGKNLLSSAGIRVDVVSDLSAEALEANRHIFDKRK